VIKVKKMILGIKMTAGAVRKIAEYATYVQMVFVKQNMKIAVFVRRIVEPARLSAVMFFVIQVKIVTPARPTAIVKITVYA
jgi:hypothetical protein